MVVSKLQFLSIWVVKILETALRSLRWNSVCNQQIGARVCWSTWLIFRKFYVALLRVLTRNFMFQPSNGVSLLLLPLLLFLLFVCDAVAVRVSSTCIKTDAIQMFSILDDLEHRQCICVELFSNSEFESMNVDTRLVDLVSIENGGWNEVQWSDKKQNMLYEILSENWVFPVAHVGCS